MKDKININMTLMQANYLRSLLVVHKYENKEVSKTCDALIQCIDNATKSLDFSENEKLVDSINNKLVKEANK